MHHCVRQIRANGDGLQGFYRGYVAGVLGIIFYRGAYFGLFDTCKVIFFDDKDRPPNAFHLWLLAQSVTVTAGMVTYPLHIIQKSLMMQSGRTPEHTQFTNIRSCIAHTYGKHGVRGFFGGFVLHLLTGTGTSFALVLYEKLKHLPST